MRLTGDKATDASDASGTLLLDLKERGWSREIVDALEVPIEWLPRVHEAPAATGQVRADVASDLGMPAGVVVAAGAGDNAAAAVGNGVVRNGLVSCSIGTRTVPISCSSCARLPDQPEKRPRADVLLRV